MTHKGKSKVIGYAMLGARRPGIEGLEPSNLGRHIRPHWLRGVIIEGELGLYQKVERRCARSFLKTEGGGKSMVKRGN